MSRFLAGLFVAVIGLLPWLAGAAQTSNPPYSGYYWNPPQGGTGFFISIQGTSLLMAGFLYDASGRATWVTSTGPVLFGNFPSQPSSQYFGTLTSYTGGQTLFGTYKPSVQSGSLGTVYIDFDTGMLTWPGGTIQLELYNFGYGGPYAGPAPMPAPSGWWWNPAEGGRGFAIETWVGYIYLAGYMYDASGNPIWYLASGQMTNENLFQGTWQQYGNGQTLTGSYQPASVVNADVAQVTLQFTSSTTATLTLPNEQIPLQLFNFTATPSPYTGTVLTTGLTSTPAGIATGPDGNIWVTENPLVTGPYTSEPIIARVTPAGVLTEFTAGFPANATPSAVTGGPDGNVWYTDPHLNSIGRVTPSGAITEFNYGPSNVATARPVQITSGPDGNLWFTIGNSKIGRITPDGQITSFTASTNSETATTSIVTGPDGNLWYTEFSGNAIGRMSPDGNFTEFSTGITPGVYTENITVGSDGNLWFTEYYGTNIGRITPAGVITLFSATFSAGSLSETSIAEGPDGEIWYASAYGLERMSTEGFLTRVSLASNIAISKFTKGPDGNIWFTGSNSVGKISAP